MLRREGRRINKKRVHRLYREKETGESPARGPLPPQQANERWSMDFVADTLLDGWRFRALTVRDRR